SNYYYTDPFQKFFISKCFILLTQLSDDNHEMNWLHGVLIVIERWRIELENSKKHRGEPSLLRTIFRTFWWEYTILALIQILNEFVIRLGTPILLGGLLRYFKKNTTETYETALLYAAGICVATAVNVVSMNHALFGAFHVGGRVRVATCSVVYRK
ncbi:unnamed protein product, partial [Heterotrigona itama]